MEALTFPEAMARVEAATGHPVMLRGFHTPEGRPCFEFWSWDGKYTSPTGLNLRTLVEDIERLAKADETP
jgi:hypothetical protein